ncbi:hypothetical protein SAMN04488029_0175 [Reichenbachiella faecimaris]|uniref:Two component regulator three Y domain-containing protein n=1 Tax=Reichenbachiella faecimaris TaxID=692418 RepID=A0A1W2G588_REIFA|nr:hypothetical protein [Reichenbachiella faecimaris]SMD31837.1 hypothetical protein SAMN04488029_0175 [Reichenbachiella faecimaris]
MTVLAILSWVLSVNSSNIEFSSASLDIKSNSGYIQLEWTSSDVTNHILEQSIEPNFRHAKTIYQGPDQASFISGLDNGTYYFRVGDQKANWSDTLKLTVAHQPLSLAYTLFGIGFLVFACTVFIVVKGARTSNTNS